MTDKTLKEVLVDARAVIADEANWRKDWYAGINENGGLCYCAVGALSVAVGAEIRPSDDALDNRPYLTKYADEDVMDYLYSFLDQSEWVGVADFNDDETTTHADVLALFDIAIESLNDLEVAA